MKGSISGMGIHLEYSRSTFQCFKIQDIIYSEEELDHSALIKVCIL